MDNILEIEHALALKIANDELDKYRNENVKLRLILDDAGIESDTSGISDAEAICTIQISKLKVTSEDRPLTKDETDIFDKLHKNLKICQGDGSRSKRKNTTKNLSSDELAKMLND